MTGSSPPRRIALAVFRLAPAGGLEQHALRLAAILARRGARVTMVTTRPPAGTPPDVEVELVASRGRSNHGRLAAFAEDAARAVAGRFDRTVACHAIPGFDAIFCADPSRAGPQGVRRWLPRYRAYAALERAALAGGDGPVLMLSSAQLDAFAANHPAAVPRLRLLPPTVDRLRADPGRRHLKPRPRRDANWLQARGRSGCGSGCNRGPRGSIASCRRCRLRRRPGCWSAASIRRAAAPRTP